MKCACIHLNDLPDEILLIIFKKLTNVAALYSLTGVSKRINRIVHDSIFTSNLTLTLCLAGNPTYPMPSLMLDRFCSQILPVIHDKIKWLNTESSSIGRVLLSASYPNLYGLGLYNLDKAKTKKLFTDISHLFKSQIVSLAIDIGKNRGQNVEEYSNSHLFTNIFTMFTNLQCLNFVSLSIRCQLFSFGFSPPTVSSSNLLELHVRLGDFSDCLYILDGRFKQLRKLHVYISTIPPKTVMNNEEKLPNLKCFSLECYTVLSVNNELIISLLNRMSNLEELDLDLVIFGRNTFLEGNNLKDLINYMPQLNKFTFNICSSIYYENQINLPSNEDIQCTFKDFKNKQIISCIDYFPKEHKGQCHIYSYPYIWKNYNNITITFPGGLFKCVRTVKLFDERPFDHQFFLRIAQSFPFLKELTVVNENEQNNQRCRKSNDDNENLPIIQYPHLTSLDLLEAHDDYVEQFLIDTRTCLSNNVYLYIQYPILARITYNFTRDATRINSSKITYDV